MQTSYERQTAEGRVTLNAVIDAGIAAGYWAQAFAYPWDHATFRDVMTESGDRFTIWCGDKKIRVTLADLEQKPNGIKAVRTSSIEAACSADRPAAEIAKALYSRVISKPEAIEGAAATRALLAERLAYRAALEANMAALAAAGFECLSHRQLSDSEYFEALMYARGSLGSVRVNATGSVYVDRLTINVKDAAALVAIAK